MAPSSSSTVLNLVSDLCPECQTLWRLLSENDESIPDSSATARTLGLRNRHQLSRWLGQHRYPPLGVLWDWVRVLDWMAVWDRTTISLVRQAWGIRVEPSVCYRTVRRVTGSTWRSLQQKGLGSLEDRFRQHVLASVACLEQARHSPRLPPEPNAPTARYRDPHIRPIVCGHSGSRLGA
jgi:hypothetical protein